MHTRALIEIPSQRELLAFIERFYETDDTFYIEDFKGKRCVNARSVIGMMYALSEFPKEMYLVNATNDGNFPGFIDKFRKDSSQI